MIKRLRVYFGRIVFLGIGLFLITLFENCAEQPQVEQVGFASVRYTHTGTETSCITCHASRLPPGPVGGHDFLHLSPLSGGTGDCVTCHRPTQWAQGQFPHDPRPTTCQECHQRQRPRSLVGTPPFDHNLNGQGDCVSCHNKNTVKFDSLADWAGGEAMPTDLVSDRNLIVTARIPQFSGTEITRVNAATVTLPLQMLHSSDQLPTGAIDSCVTCHAGAGSGNMRGGIFHSVVTSLPVPTSQPALCMDCHSGARPVGFVGSVNSARSPATGPMRHEATVWSKGPDGNYSPSSTPIVSQECSTCHKSPGVSWAGAQFHSNLASQPTSCIACHSNTRPPGNVGNPPFNHFTRGGTQECTVCHNVTNFASATGWANGQFPHTNVVSCAECHSGQRPSSTTGWVQTGWNSTKTLFDLAKHGGSTDCISCHSGTIQFNSAADWATGHYNHTPKPGNCVNCHAYPIGPVGSPATDHKDFGGQDCIGCHTNTTNYASLTGWAGATSVPGGLVNGDINKFPHASWTVNPVTLVLTAGRVTGVTTQANVKLPMQMLHSSPNVSSAQLANCASCHTVGYTAASGTRYHTSIANQPTANCASCHSPNGLPKGIVGPKAVASGTVNMDHSALYASGQSVVQAQDCVSCHSKPGVEWNDGEFHSKLGGNALANCTACHGAKMPLTTVASQEAYTSSTAKVIPQHFNHSSPYVTQDCASCHLQKGPLVPGGKEWETNVKKFHSLVAGAGITSCNSCHVPDRPLATEWYAATPSSKYLHSPTYNGDKDCFGCHTKKPVSNFVDLTKIGSTWTGGLYNHKDSNNAKVGSATCATCHTPFTSGVPVYINGQVRNCTDCHSGNVGTLSFFSHHKKGFGSKSTQRSACMSCHGAAPF